MDFDNIIIVIIIIGSLGHRASQMCCVLCLYYAMHYNNICPSLSHTTSLSLSLCVCARVCLLCMCMGKYHNKQLYTVEIFFGSFTVRSFPPSPPTKKKGRRWYTRDDQKKKGKGRKRSENKTHNETFCFLFIRIILLLYIFCVWSRPNKNQQNDWGYLP